MAEGGEAEAPKDINFKSLVVDLSFHPTRDVIASGDIEGDVFIHSYSTTEENHLLLELPHHKKACRALQFAPDGAKLLSASKDKSIQAVDLVVGKVVTCLEKAHDSPLYSLLVIDNNMVASGDDDGVIKLWDLRRSSGEAVMALHECEEFISDLAVEKRGRIMLATSGDGSLSAYDIRSHKLKVKSETFDAEFLSLAIVKDEKNVVCGTGDGILNIFNWNEFGYISDRFPGHPLSIDCILPVTPDVVLTGSMDGYIRAINVLPNRLLGLVGQHKDFPVENLSLSRCKKYVASCSHDQKIKFWNVSGLGEEEIDSREKPRHTLKQSVQKQRGSDFFSDLAGPSGAGEKGGDVGGSDSDEDSDDSEEGGDGGEGGDKNKGGEGEEVDSDSGSDGDDNDGENEENEDEKNDT